VFAAHTNRVRRSLVINAQLAPAILAYRPKSEQKLTGDALCIAGAKEFARQVRQYARNHNLSTVPTRDGCKVTFRFAKPREASKNGEVTVTQQS
jgi:hypothetical protein